LGLLPTLPIVLELVERHTGQSEGAASGLIWLTGNLGGVVVTAATGLLTSIPAIAFLVCGCGVLLAAPLVRGLSAPVTAAETPAPNTHGAQAIKLGTRGARARRVPPDAVASLQASTLITREFHDHEGFAGYSMQILRDHGLIMELSCPDAGRTGQTERPPRLRTPLTSSSCPRCPFLFRSVGQGDDVEREVHAAQQNDP
jgi:hypothetical protein